MAAQAQSRRLGGVALIVVCLLGSAAMRLVDSGAAIAGEIGALGEGEERQAAGEGDALLAAIREREASLAAEETRLADRRQALNVAEAKLAEQLAAFETAQRQLQETLAMADKAAERDIAQMSAVYESMKPADAARIVGKMDVSFASGLMVELRPETAAAILSGMEPEQAYAITLTIASRNARVPRE